MSQPRTDIAWMLVRKAPTLSDQDIVDATGVHRRTLAQMRQQRTLMLDSGTVSRDAWDLDSPSYVITHSEVAEDPAV